MEGKNMTKNANGSDRNQMPCLNELLDACARHTLSKRDVREVAGEDTIVIREAYIPYIPPQWNDYLVRYLVLAESQNLANANDADVKRLKGLLPRERMNRLGNGNDLGVGPWDDGSLPCAMKAAFCLDSHKIAVSNAVPWSRIKPDGNNENPSKKMKDKAVRFWEDLLPLIKPTHIITAGKVAEDVIKRVDPTRRYCRKNIRLPSPQAMSRISGMFDVEDLLRRYPEVQKAVQDCPKLFQKHNRQTRQNKVFFACHVVSLYGQNEDS